MLPELQNPVIHFEALIARGKVWADPGGVECNDPGLSRMTQSRTENQEWSAIAPPLRRKGDDNSEVRTCRMALIPASNRLAMLARAWRLALPQISGKSSKMQAALMTGDANSGTLLKAAIASMRALSRCSSSGD